MGYTKLIVVVIYTSDVKSAVSTLDLNFLKLKVEQVFLSKFNTDEIYNDLKNKIHNGIPLSNEDVIKFIMLPLTQKNNKQDEVYQIRN
jgi:uncharacterized protein with ParB-like and HNH nuclease domain